MPVASGKHSLTVVVLNRRAALLRSIKQPSLQYVAFAKQYYDYRGTASLLSDLERRPRTRIQIAQHALFPIELWVLLQVLGGLEVDSIGVAHGGGEGHPGDHRSVGGLILHGSRRPKCGLPGTGTTRGKVNVATHSVRSLGAVSCVKVS